MRASSPKGWVASKGGADDPRALPVPTSGPPRHPPRGRCATTTTITTTTAGSDDDLAQDVIDGGARLKPRGTAHTAPPRCARENAYALLRRIGPAEHPA